MPYPAVTASQPGGGEMPGVLGQPGASDSGLVAQQLSTVADEPMLQASAAEPDASLSPGVATKQAEQQSPEPQADRPKSSGLPGHAPDLITDKTEPDLVRVKTEAVQDLVTVKTEAGSMPTQELVNVKAEPDVGMEAVQEQSAADIFEQTVKSCRAVVSDTSSVLLDDAAPDAPDVRTSRIAASERATMWHKELQGRLKRCTVPQLYIGVLGDTGTQPT